LKPDLTIAGLVLAAGESSRMGRDKALLTYHGHSFLETVVATLRKAGLRQIVVVLGHHADEIRRAVELDEAEIVNNSDYRQGQTSSLQAGLRALKTSAVEGIILALVDHPAVSARVVRSLVQDFQESRAPVVIPTFQNRRGHPVLIGRVLFAELLSLSAAEGANTVIRRYGDAARLVEVADPAVLRDIDDPESYLCLAGT
jgi:molybdenum cofactor cytidylyltransferase